MVLPVKNVLYRYSEGRGCRVASQCSNQRHVLKAFVSHLPGVVSYIESSTMFQSAQIRENPLL